MALPLAPLVPIVLRIGAVTGAGYALSRAVTARVKAGRTDQRAEDALDDLQDGLALHRPADRTTDGEGQTNAAARLRRTIRWGKGGVEIDAGFLARFRIRRL